MRRKFLAVLAILLALSMLLVGCGGNRSATGEPSNTDTSMDDGGESGADEESGDEDTTSDVSDQQNGLSGIIVLSYTQTDGGDANSGKYDIRSLDLNTGEITDYASFNVSDEGQVLYLTSRCGNNWRWTFSKDFDKMAVTAIYPNGERHAGWIDRNGDFTDVTKALGLVPEGDFSDPALYEAEGFSEDGKFVYYDKHDIFEKGDSRRSIDPDNLDPNNIQACEANIYSGITDLIDEAHCIVDSYNSSHGTLKSVIKDTTTNEITEYIPETSSLLTWGGVLSPNGTQIAFLSRAIQSRQVISLYVVPKDGGEPVKQDVPDIFTLTDEGAYIGGAKGDFTTIVDWQ